MIKKKKNGGRGLEGGVNDWCMQVIPQETTDAPLQ